MGMFDDLESKGTPSGGGGMFDDLEKSSPQKSSLATSFLHGAGSELYGTLGKTAALAGAGLAVIGDKARGMVTGQNDTTAQDWAFKNLVDPMTAKAEQYAPTAEEAKSIPLSVAHGLGGMAVDLPLIMGTAGKVGLPEAAGVAARAVQGITAMAPVAVAHAASGTAGRIEQGTDLPTAFESGALTGLSTLAMGAVPIAMRGGLATRAATGALSSIVTGEADRQLQNSVLSDRPDLKTEITGPGLATQAATGALLGVIMGPRPLKTQIAAAKAEAAADVNSGAPLPEAAQDSTPAQIGYTNSPNANPEAKTVFPNGQAGTRADVEKYLAALPDDMARMKARASIYGVATEEPRVTDKEASETVESRLAEAAKMEAEAEAEADARINAAKDAAGQEAESRGATPEEIKKAQIDAAYAENAALQLERQNSQTEKNAAQLVESGRDTQVDQANALTKAQGFDEPPLTAMQLAMQNAQAVAAERAMHLAEVQKITDARMQTEAAAAEISNPAAKPIEEFTQALSEVMPVAYPDASDRSVKAAQTRATNNIMAAIGDAANHADQLDAIAALRDTSPKGGVMESIYGSLYDKLTEGKETHNESQPTEAPPPETEQTEAQRSESPRNEPAATKDVEKTPRENLLEAQSTLDDTVAKLDSRVANGEVLPPEEQARYEKAQELQKTVDTSLGLSDTALNTKLANANAMPELAMGVASPESWKAESTKYLVTSDPEARSLPLEHLVKTSPDVGPILNHLVENGSTQWVKDLAGKLQGLGLKTAIGESPLLGHFDPDTQAAYNKIEDRIAVMPGGSSEQTILHELIHAATAQRVDQAAAIYAPRNQAEAKMKQAYDGLEKLRMDATRKTDANGQYGLTNAHEFIAELNSNPGFQDFLRSKSLWSRTVDVVKNLLGMKTSNDLEKAMSLQGEFFGKEPYEAAQRYRETQQEFDSSPQGASKVTDNTLQFLIKASDDETRAVDWKTLDRGVFHQLLGWKTVQYIADRARAIPEFVSSGLAKGVDAYEKTYGVRAVAHGYAEGKAAQFAQNVQMMLHGLGDSAKARELSRKMSEISVGSSIGGFDPTKNFADNLKTRADLSPTNAAYVNDIYRQFKALEKTNPAAAQAIVDGAKINRKSFVLDNATVISNLMNHAAGNVIKLEGMLNQMDPTDVNRARMENKIAAAKAEAGVSLAHAPGLDFMSKEVQGARNGDTMNHVDGASYVLDQRIKAAFAMAAKLPEGSTLRDQLGEIEKIYSNQIDNPYYHAGRSGEYFVNVGFKDMDEATWAKMNAALAGTNKVLGDYANQNHAFFRVETADQAAGLRAKLVTAAGLKVDMEHVADGQLAQSNQLSNNAGISRALRSVLGTLHDVVKENPGVSPEQTAAMQEAMTRKFLSMLPETSSRAASMKRMGVPGYDGDFLGSFSKRAAGGIMDTANIYTMRAYADAFKQMNDSVETLNRTGSTDGKVRGQMIADEITKRYNNSMQPVDNSHVNLINSLGHSFYLALAPAFFIRTMAQPFHRGLPYLGSKFGMVSTAKEIAGATGIAMKIMASTIKNGYEDNGVRGILNAEMNFKDMGLTPKEEAFVQELHDRGTLNLGQSRQLQRMAIGGSQLTQDAVRFTSMTAQYAEMTNRLSTALAAFRLAEKKGAGVGLGDATAHTDYAIKAVKYVMDDFDPNNTARQIGKQGFAGKVTPLMTSFMNYNLQTMQQIARTVHDGMFNKDFSPEGVRRSAEAKREFGGIMATTAMISGVMGLPFVNAFAGVYNMLMGDEDNPQDIRNGVRNGLSDMFGQEGGRVIARGAGGLIGVDTSTFGLENLLPGTEFLASRRLLKDKWGDTAKGLMGPALNAGMDIGLALAKISDGQYVKGIEQALPSGLKGYWKAGELATRGYTDAKGNPIGLPATPWDIAVQSTGLRPSDKAEQAEAQSYMVSHEERLSHRKQIIGDEIYKAVTRGDQDDKTAAFGAMNDLNRKNPYEPIKDISGIFRQHASDMAVAKATETGVGGGVKKFPVLNTQLRFAKQGGMP